jgi:hypothetical protein
LRSALNPNSFYAQNQELSAELSEVYSSKFELIYDALQSGKQKATKKVKTECNELCQKSIENARFVAETIYKSDDKFEYIKAVMNMEL